MRRFLTALWACWFVLLVNEPLLLHACPMHDGSLALLAEQSKAAQSAAERGDGDARAMASHDMASHDMASHDMASHAAMMGGNLSRGANSSVANSDVPSSQSHDPSQPSQHSCTCLGHCASAVALSLPEGAPLAWLAGVIDVNAPLVPSVGVLPSATPHVLPFANGPPPRTLA